MKAVRSLSGIRRAVSLLRKRKGRVGFVPTMGALHAGHLSLVRRAKKENGAALVSIFVNPLQFGPGEDLKRYPRDLRGDARALRKAGADLLFVPDEKRFYGPDFQTEVRVRKLSLPLCGRSRPVHFAGVATVVSKLLNLTAPDVLYLGQKDYQQTRVLARMLEDLAWPVRVRVCPTVREKDGLAMSSRNVLLSAEERRQARFLPEALNEAAVRVRRGQRNARKVLAAARARLQKARGARIEYLELVDASTLAPVIQLKPRQRVLVALAVHFSRTRLIDNRLMKVR